MHIINSAKHINFANITIAADFVVLFWMCVFIHLIILIHMHSVACIYIYRIISAGTGRAAFRGLGTDREPGGQLSGGQGQFPCYYNLNKNLIIYV